MSKSLPAGWVWVAIGDVIERVEDNLTDSDTSDFERFLKVEHMDADSLKIRRWGLIEDGDLPPTFRKVFRAGQVLYPTRNPHLRRTVYADFDGICGEKTLVLQAKNGLIPDLTPFIFQREDLIEYATSVMVGSTNPHIRWRDLAAFEFALPPKDEQRRIAEILWAAESSIQIWRDAANTLSFTKEKVAQRLFHFRQARDSNPRLPVGWTKGRLKELMLLNPKMPPDIDYGMKVSFIGMADISDKGGIESFEIRTVNEVQKGYTYFEESDVLFAKITPCMENGKGALAMGLENGTGFGSTEFFVLRAHTLSDAQFLYQLTMTRFFRRHAERFMRGSAGQQRVPRDFVTDYEIIIPPQGTRKNISRILASFDDCSSYIKHNLGRLEILKSQLLKYLLLDMSRSGR